VQRSLGNSCCISCNKFGQSTVKCWPSLARQNLYAEGIVHATEAPKYGQQF